MYSQFDTGQHRSLRTVRQRDLTIGSDALDHHSHILVQHSRSSSIDFLQQYGGCERLMDGILNFAQFLGSQPQ